MTVVFRSTGAISAAAHLCGTWWLSLAPQDYVSKGNARLEVAAMPEASEERRGVRARAHLALAGERGGPRECRDAAVDRGQLAPLSHHCARGRAERVGWQGIQRLKRAARD